MRSTFSRGGSSFIANEGCGDSAIDISDRGGGNIYNMVIPVAVV